MQFSAFCKRYWRKYQPSKTAKLLSGKNVNKPYILCIKNVVFFKGNFSENIRYVGLKCSEITEIVILFQYSEGLFILLHQIMISIIC